MNSIHGNIYKIFDTGRSTAAGHSNGSKGIDRGLDQHIGEGKHTTLDSGWQPDPQHADQLIFLNIQLSDVQVTGAICPAQTIQDQNGT